MIDGVQSILTDQLRTIVTGWGVVGTAIAAFTGPVAVQRLKIYFCDGVIGKRNTKRRRLTLGTAAAVITFVVSVSALMQEYSNTGGIILVAILVALFQITIVELLFAYVDKKGGQSEKWKAHVYTPDQDNTIMPDDPTEPRE
jgi:uncharacterized membrane protein